MTSFNTLSLNGSTLTVNGTDYNLSLSQTAEGTDSSLSSFKGIAAVDNGDGTISLTVGDNSVVVEKYETVVMPTKGDLITMTLGNAAPAAGTNNQYRVLKVNGSVAEVVAMFDYTSRSFGSYNTYAGSSLDTYFTGWYNNLNTDAKSAIVAKNVQQYQYSTGTYDANTHASYADYLTKAEKGSAVSRNVYALDVEDIEQYFGGTSSAAGTFSTADIWTMFYNTISAPSKTTYPWLRSSQAGSSNLVFFVNGNYGRVGSSGSGDSRAARPAFTIDLSKIEWSKV